MNFIEFEVLVVSSLILFLYLYRNLASLKQAVFATLLLLLPLYISIEMTTQFLTVDEIMICEPAGLVLIPVEPLRCWELFAFRTTDLLFGAITYIFYKLSNIPMLFLPILKMLFKSMHWFLGFTIIILIHNLLTKNFIFSKNKFYFSVLFVYSALVLPTNALALKIFNYDLFSAFLSVCSIIFLLSAIKLKKSSLTFISLIMAFFAAQEKLSASPVFLLSSVMFCFLNSINQKRKYLAAFLLAILAIEIGLSISTLTFFTVGVIRNFDSLNINLGSISFPVTAFWWPLMRLIMKGDSHIPMTLHPLFFLLGSVLVISYFTFILFKLYKLMPRLLKVLSISNIMLCWVFLIIGIFSTYFINVYWAPLFPIKNGFYYPQVSFNKYIWHFGASTKFMHILDFIAFSISVFINAIPSVFWFILSIVTFYTIKNRKNKEKDIFLAWEGVFFVALLIPVIFGAIQAPIASRYFSISIFIFVIVVLIKFDKILQYLDRKKKVTIVLGFMIFLTLELLPFRPLLAPFRPIWANYSKEYNKIPVVGKVNASWLGWGEEVMLAGKKIAGICRRENIDFNDVHIYHNYRGEWIGSEIPNIYFSFKDARYTNLDFYIISRSAVVSRKTSAFPYSIEPLFTLEYRGFVHAWIFRGDQLKKANFKFD